MAQKRKLKQISNNDEKSMADLNLTQMKEKPKIREWRRQILQKIQRLYLNQTEKKVFQLPSRS